MTRTAACSCRQCTISVRGEPEINAICHCRSCQRRTGSAFGWSAYFKNEQVTATVGAFRTYSIKGDAGSENAAERVFCGTCGTTLFWRSIDFPGLTGIAGGCFGAEAPLPEPTLTVSHESRHAWVTLPAGWKTDW
jgi:hypothetical protein